MSGGTIGSYGFSEVEDAASQIRSIINTNEAEAEYGIRYAPETLERFKQIANLLDAAAVAWKDVDWLVSGDTGEDDWVSTGTLAALAPVTEEGDRV
jgi:hypothetical protein